MGNLVSRDNHSKSPFTVCHSAAKLIIIIVSSDCKCKGRLQTKDKVNYAISEREDRVTDVTMLKRMIGCSGLYWAVLGCNCNGLKWAFKNYTGLYWVAMG